MMGQEKMAEIIKSNCYICFLSIPTNWKKVTRRPFCPVGIEDRAENG
jgi:hypothetical protein